MERSIAPSVVALQERIFSLVYRAHGLRLARVHVDDHTEVCCWLPASHKTRRRRSSARSRPPLLLIHGFGASSLDNWVHQVPAFARHFDLYVPHLVFFGHSRSSSAGRSEVFQAEAMLALLDRLGIDTCPVVGVSYGGLVAYRMATLQPSRVSRLVLGGSGVMTSLAEHRQLLERFGVRSAAELLLPTDPQGLTRLMRVAHNHAVKLPAWILRDALERLFENRAEKQQMLEALKPLGESDVSVPPMPTLLVWGDSDQVFPLEIGQRMHKHFGAQCELVVLPEAAHALQTHRPRQFNRTVLHFLRAPDHTHGSACEPAGRKPHDAVSASSSTESTSSQLSAASTDSGSSSYSMMLPLEAMGSVSVSQSSSGSSVRSTARS